MKVILLLFYIHIPFLCPNKFPCINSFHSFSVFIFLCSPTFPSFQWSASSSCAYAWRLVYWRYGSFGCFQWSARWLLDGRLFGWWCSTTLAALSFGFGINGKFLNKKNAIKYLKSKNKQIKKYFQT